MQARFPLEGIGFTSFEEPEVDQQKIRFLVIIGLFFTIVIILVGLNISFGF